MKEPQDTHHQNGVRTGVLKGGRRGNTQALQVRRAGAPTRHLSTRWHHATHTKVLIPADAARSRHLVTAYGPFPRPLPRRLMDITAAIDATDAAEAENLRRSHPLDEPYFASRHRSPLPAHPCIETERTPRSWARRPRKVANACCSAWCSRFVQRCSRYGAGGGAISANPHSGPAGRSRGTRCPMATR
ncbi:MAG: hypothetical protein ACJA14_000644 [Ilumatobacter sp.]|jgi:hypothetical protein